LSCFTNKKNNAAIIPITFIAQKDYPTWQSKQSDAIKSWLNGTQFKADASLGDTRLIPDAHGNVARVVCAVANPNDMWCVGNLPLGLPEGVYEIENENIKSTSMYALAWALSSYQFTRYKKATRLPAQLDVSALSAAEFAEIENIVAAHY